MLELFRRYQKFLFIVVTAVVIISFSFFGTYGSISNNEVPDSVAFTAVDKSSVYASELNDIIALLDQGQKASFNDGVMEKDILEAGIGEIIVQPYLPKLGADFKLRHEKEKNFIPYTHPGAPFIGADTMWGYFAPDIKTNLEKLKSEPDAATLSAFKTRANLYLAENRFPSIYLKQFVRYQEKQYSWLQPDAELNYRDLSLFGYHSLQDWFGKDFITLVAKYIINSAKIAEKRGYKVSKDEALKSLVANAQASFNEHKKNPAFRFPTLDAYFRQELMQLGLDETRLIDAWSKVLLFRKLFQESREALVVSELPYKDFYEQMNAYVDCECYKLPVEFQLKNMHDLQLAELYLNALRNPKETKFKGLQSFPLEQISSADEIQKTYPELVKRRYRLKFAAMDKDALEMKIGVKSTWEWQLEDKNWEKLQNKFPELALKKASSEEEKLNMLELVDSKTRSLIDAFSRAQILDAHPEWIKEAFESANRTEDVYELRAQGGEFPFEGIEKRLEFFKLLDSAPINEESPKLISYSQDLQHYYHIIVVEKPQSSEILTFNEALKDGTMEALLNKTLEGQYSRIRSQSSEKFVNEKGDFKPFQQVKEQVASIYFEELTKRLEREVEVVKKEMPTFCDFTNKEQALIAVSLLPYMKKAWQNVKDDKDIKSYLAQEGKVEPELSNQFKLVHSNERILFAKAEEYGVSDEAFSIDSGSWLEPRYVAGSGITFLKLNSNGIVKSDDSLHAKVIEARDLLGRGLSLDLSQNLLAEMQAKGAL